MVGTVCGFDLRIMFGLLLLFQESKKNFKRRERERERERKKDGGMGEGEGKGEKEEEEEPKGISSPWCSLKYSKVRKHYVQGLETPSRDSQGPGQWGRLLDSDGCLLRERV